jgi:hypothetical protein
MSRHFSRFVLGASCVFAVAGLTTAIHAQASASAATVAATPARLTTGIPQRDTLVRMTRTVTVDFQDQRVEDVITFIQTSSGADLEPMWADDRNTDGLDKDRLISVKVQNQTFLLLLEKVLDAAKPDIGGDNAWQMSETGAMQVGPKERLNRVKRVEIYDINDLIMEIPDYRDIPRIDLQQALQSSQGGGSGQSPFREEGQDDQMRTRERQERAEELMELLQSIVEPEQWVENGGTGGSIRLFQGTLIVNAPDYMHRGLNGYRYWPSRSTVSSMSNGRRYVSLTTDAGLAKVLGFGQQPVSAVVGGRVIQSGPPGGGG